MIGLLTLSSVLCGITASVCVQENIMLDHNCDTNIELSSCLQKLVGQCKVGKWIF